MYHIIATAILLSTALELLSLIEPKYHEMEPQVGDLICISSGPIRYDVYLKRELSRFGFEAEGLRGSESSDRPVYVHVLSNDGDTSSYPLPFATSVDESYPRCIIYSSGQWLGQTDCRQNCVMVFLEAGNLSPEAQSK